MQSFDGRQRGPVQPIQREHPAVIQELSYLGLLQQVIELIQRPITAHSRLAALMVLDGVEDRRAGDILERLSLVDSAGSLESRIAKLAINGECFGESREIQSKRGENLAWSAVPSAESIMQMHDVLPKSALIPQGATITPENAEVQEQLSLLNERPRFASPTPEQARRISAMIGSYHFEPSNHPAHPNHVDGTLLNFRLAKLSALNLGGVLERDVQRRLLQHLDFGAPEGANWIGDIHREPTVDFPQNIARPSVAWACAQALNQTLLDEMSYSQLLIDMLNANFSSDRSAPLQLQVSDNVLAATFVLNGQLRRNWRNWK